MNDGPLTKAHRCDRCPAQAMVRFMIAFSGIDLCSHHATEHQAALLDQGFTITQDIRETEHV